ncbi:MAG: DUF4097 family beta strand repeat protein, partial [Ktedonobacteraceae bacterium]|nr:DUF4097 family beta strand repeat protein [Ktedonobacteraceae bacterium]
TNAGTIAIASAELAADSSLHTNAGTITIRQSTVNDKTRGHTNAGTITIVQSALKGGASFTTNAGTIHFNGSIAPNGDYIFKTNAGTIDAILPADSSFALTAHTSMGTVTNEFRSNLVGDGPYARLNLETPMGTITVRRQR